MGIIETVKRFLFSSNEDFFILVKANNVEGVKKLIADGTDVNVTKKNSLTALHYAATNLNKAMIKLLLNYKADVNAKDENDETPFYKGLRSILLEIHCSINDKDFYGPTAKEKEAEYIAILIILLESGADINAKTKFGKTPLSASVTYSHREIVELLLDNGADLNSVDKHGYTSLHIAAYQNKKDIAKILINRGANIDIKDKDGQTPLHYAAIINSKDMIMLLLEFGACKNIINNDNHTAADLAEQKNNFVIKELINNYIVSVKR